MLERVSGPKARSLTQITEEDAPPRLHKIVLDIVDRIDAIVVEVAYAGWTQSDSEKYVRRELQTAPKSTAHPSSAISHRTYRYLRENHSIFPCTGGLRAVPTGEVRVRGTQSAVPLVRGRRWPPIRSCFRH